LCNQSAQTPTRCARGTPSLVVNGYKEIGLFVAAIYSLYLRLPYNRHLVLVKNPFARALSGWPNAFSL
jgi:hypothetical protein